MHTTEICNIVAIKYSKGEYIFDGELPSYDLIWMPEDFSVNDDPVGEDNILLCDVITFNFNHLDNNILSWIFEDISEVFTEQDELDTFKKIYDTVLPKNNDPYLSIFIVLSVFMSCSEDDCDYEVSVLGYLNIGDGLVTMEKL